MSKTQPIQLIETAYQAGIVHFGENYAQEAAEKINQLKHLPITWHFIGPIQSNKCAFIAQHIAWIHCLDRLKIAKRLNQLCIQPNGRKLNVLIQINISLEPSKSGISLTELPQFVQHLRTYKQLQLRGLTVIPKPNLPIDILSQQFTQIHQAFLQLQQQNSNVDTLSMGMSNDYELAILHGSTLIRLGTALFGTRRKKI